MHVSAKCKSREGCFLWWERWHIAARIQTSRPGQLEITHILNLFFFSVPFILLVVKVTVQPKMRCFKQGWFGFYHATQNKDWSFFFMQLQFMELKINRNASKSIINVVLKVGFCDILQVIVSFLGWKTVFPLLTFLICFPLHNAFLKPVFLIIAYWCVKVF